VLLFLGRLIRLEKQKARAFMEMPCDVRGGASVKGVLRSAQDDRFVVVCLRAARFLLGQPALTICGARAMARESLGTSVVMQLAAAT
jgi:hypothetical protein